MLVEFRAAVVEVLKDKLDTPLWETIPDDVAELPCIVVAMPGAVQTSTAVVFDTSVDVVVIGRRQQAGESESELVALTDDVWLTLGATRGTRDAAGAYSLGVVRLDPRVVTVAGQQCSAYVITVESSIATC